MIGSKGIDKAIEYGKKRIDAKSNPKLDFLAGYNHAIADFKTHEMLDMLQKVVHLFKRGEFDTSENIGGRMLIKAEELIKEATNPNES